VFLDKKRQSADIIYNEFQPTQWPVKCGQDINQKADKTGL